MALRAAGGETPDGSILDVFTDPTPDAMANENGSRLKARYRLGDDGSRDYLPGEWWDSALGTICQYRVAADGATRCLPPAIPATGVSLDAACTQELVEIPVFPVCPEYNAGYAYKPAPATLCGGRSIFSVGAPLVPATVYAQGSCMPIPNVNTWGLLGAEIPPATFVGSTIAHD